MPLLRYGNEHTFRRSVYALRRDLRYTYSIILVGKDVAAFTFCELFEWSTDNGMYFPALFTLFHALCSLI